MATIVTKVLRDGDGNSFQMRFVDRGDGTLVPLHAFLGGDETNPASDANPVPFTGVVLLPGGSPAGDDVTGTGADPAVDVGVATRFLDFFNGGQNTAVVSNGSQARSVPAGAGRLLIFDQPAQVYGVTADGPWIATPMA